MKKIEGYKITKPPCCVTCRRANLWHDGCVDCKLVIDFVSDEGKTYYEPTTALGWCPKYEERRDCSPGCTESQEKCNECQEEK